MDKIRVATMASVLKTALMIGSLLSHCLFKPMTSTVISGTTLDECIAITIYNMYFILHSLKLVHKVNIATITYQWIPR